MTMTESRRFGLHNGEFTIDLAEAGTIRTQLNKTSSCSFGPSGGHANCRCICTGNQCRQKEHAKHFRQTGFFTRHFTHIWTAERPHVLKEDVLN